MGEVSEQGFFLRHLRRKMHRLLLLCGSEFAYASVFVCSLICVNVSERETLHSPVVDLWLETRPRNCVVASLYSHTEELGLQSTHTNPKTKQAVFVFLSVCLTHKHTLLMEWDPWLHLVFISHFHRLSSHRQVSRLQTGSQLDTRLPANTKNVIVITSFLYYVAIYNYEMYLLGQGS